MSSQVMSQALSGRLYLMVEDKGSNRGNCDIAMEILIKTSKNGFKSKNSLRILKMGNIHKSDHY